MRWYTTEAMRGDRGRGGDEGPGVGIRGVWDRLREIKSGAGVWQNDTYGVTRDGSRRRGRQ